MTGLERAFRWFSMIVLATFASLIVWAVWSVLYPYDIMKVKPGSWIVQNVGKRVKRGEALLLYVDYCADFKEPPQMDTRLEQDGRLMLLKPHQFPAAPHGCYATTVPFTIPRVLAIESTTAAGLGTAKLEITLHYRVNALRDVQYHFTSESFRIDP